MRSLSRLLLVAVPAFAQTTPPPAFEVASIRINPRMGREIVEPRPGSLTLRDVRFTTILQFAYQVQAPVISGPDWMTSQRYDILAKAGHPASDIEMRPMLQTLLAERFHLAVHRETKEMRVFALVQAKGGHKMTANSTEGPAEESGDFDKRFSIRRTSIAALAEEMARDLRTPVLDLTGLNGRYDFSINFQRYRGEDLASLPVLESILKNDLGLQLKSRKAPVELLIVDRADRIPTEN